jgi:hypothetical protein
VTYHLIAFATNCTSPERAEVEWTLATCGPDGNWYDWNGQRFYPFHTQPTTLPDLPIPFDWIPHVQSIARRNMHDHAEPAFDLTAALGLHQAKPAAPAPFPRRI